MENTTQSPGKHYRACHLCEATCGLEIVHDEHRILSIKGDRADPLSRGHYCPKALVLKDILNDPDRLRKPVKRVGEQWKEISWDEAFDTVVDRLVKIRAAHGPNSIGSYMGNPCVHNWGMMTHAGHFVGPLQSQNRYSATSVDQLPHHLVGLKMYGHRMLVPVPDIDRTHYFLIIGGNPVASNGSMMTVPNVRKRIKALIQRGGKLVVVDPRKTETAKLATEHCFIRPGTDAYFLLAILNTLFARGLPDSNPLLEHCSDLEPVKKAVGEFTPQKAEAITGIPSAAISRIAQELAEAKAAVCYGRMGVSVQRFGSLCQWIIQLINIITGNLDKPGGALFSRPAFDTVAGPGSRPGHFARWHSRVSHLPEFAGELPAAALAEEILTEGAGQIKALFTAAANPVLTSLNGTRLEEALSGLDFMVSLDIYINETTRFADIILPATFALEHDHYDIAFNVLAVRNVTRYNPPLFEKPAGTLHDWEIYTELGKRLCHRLGVKPKPDNSPDEMLDFMLQTSTYGSHVKHPLALSLDELKKHPHGLDLGPLEPSLPERLATADKKIVCAPPLFLEDISRVKTELESSTTDQDSLLLIGRRHLFDANSWLHNYPRLLKGKERCLLYLHPQDADKLQISDLDNVRVSSAAGSVAVRVQLTDDVMPGTVCLPHGWGHHRPGTRLAVAEKHAGVSMNDLTDDKQIDPVSGNGVLNAIPVRLEKTN